MGETEKTVFAITISTYVPIQFLSRATKQIARLLSEACLSGHLLDNEVYHPAEIKVETNVCGHVLASTCTLSEEER